MVETTSMSRARVCGTSESEVRAVPTSHNKIHVLQSGYLDCSESRNMRFFTSSEHFRPRVSSPPNLAFECRRLLLADRLTVVRSLSVRKTCRLPTLFPLLADTARPAGSLLAQGR